MHTANDAVLAEGRRVLIDGPGRFDGVAVVGVDEHAWRHTRRGDKYVNVIIDLTAVRAGTGPASLSSSSAADRKARTIAGYDEQELGANVALRSFCTESWPVRR